jgi:hypothetical protein
MLQKYKKSPISFVLQLQTTKDKPEANLKPLKIIPFSGAVKHFACNL